MLKWASALLLLIPAAIAARAAFGDVVTDDIRKRLCHNLHNIGVEIPFTDCGKEEEDEAFTAQTQGAVNVQALMKGSNEDYFMNMDYGITLPDPVHRKKLLDKLSPYFPGIGWDEATLRMARGRDNWIVWTFGNDKFWSYMTRATLGGLDFLKTISDHPSLGSQRHNRWQIAGLVNEPCFEEAKGPNKDRWGLWLPKRKPGCEADPFENTSKYPGVQIGARGKSLPAAVEWDQQGNPTKFEDRDLPVGSFYGYATGVVGLRLFPNPDFDEAAARKWNPERYYKDLDYALDPNLVRPYRVGMACAFCHVGPNPSHPPKDMNNPEWANLNSNPGAQYWWVDRIFDWNWKRDQNSFIYQLLHTSRPGSVDTSLVSSDMINNPRTMNAVYDLPARVKAAIDFNHIEVLKGDENLNAQFGKITDEKLVPSTSPLKTLSGGNTVISPRVLKDGSDSVGALGALNRVYVNIGLFSEEWIQDFIPVIGGPNFIPFSIDLANRKSIYWQANVNQTPDVALFFLAATDPDRLSEALKFTPEKLPNDPKYKLAADDSSALTSGKHAFAKQCAQCHSSKQPEKVYKFFNRDNKLECTGANYLKCWNDYWAYIKTPEYKKSIDAIVMQPDFLEHNFLSTEVRVPNNILDDQLCSAVATNAIRGDTWDNFSSDTYKNLPSIGDFLVNYPTADGSQNMKSKAIKVPAGGRGYIRPASLISVWSTAPFLQNNSLGKFHWEGTTKARLDSYYESIDLLLNPEKRAAFADPNWGEMPILYRNGFSEKPLPGVMDVTTQTSYLKIPRMYLPGALFAILKVAIDAAPADIKSKIYHKGVAMNDTSWRSKARGIASDKEKKEKVESKGIIRTIANVFTDFFKPKPSPELESQTAKVDSAEAGDFIYLGPIPKGVPVNLISNIDLAHLKDPDFFLDPAQLIPNPRNKFVDAVRTLLATVVELSKRVKDAEDQGKTYDLDGEGRLFFLQGATKGLTPIPLLNGTLTGKLLNISKCQDFVVNRGHYFGTQYGPQNTPDGKVEALTDEEKTGLIEFLKTM